MKRHVPILVMTAILFASVIAVSAQRPPMVGGYKAIANTDAGAVAAANFAVETQSEKQVRSIRSKSWSRPNARSCKVRTIGYVWR